MSVCVVIVCVTRANNCVFMTLIAVACWFLFDQFDKEEDNITGAESRNFRYFIVKVALKLAHRKFQLWK